MTLEIPKEIPSWVVAVVAGPWPEGDEDALRRLGAAWKEIGDAITTVSQLTGDARTKALAAIEGETGEALDKHGIDLDGDLEHAANACYGLSEQCMHNALSTEYSKYVIVGCLVALVLQLGVDAFVPGVGQVHSAAATAATRLTVRAAVRELIARLGTEGARAAASRLVRVIAFKGVTLGAIQGGAIPLVAQAVQMSGPENYRTEIDWGDVGLGVVSGAAAGAAGEFFGVRTMIGLERRFANNATSTVRNKLTQVGVRFAGAGVGGVAGAVAGVVSVVPFTGQLDMGWDHLLPGLVGGVLGSMPHALRGPAGPAIGAPVGGSKGPAGEGPGAGGRVTASPGDDGPPPSLPPGDEGVAVDRPGTGRDEGAPGGRNDDPSVTAAQPRGEGDPPVASRAEGDGRAEGEARPETAARPEAQPRPDTEVRPRAETEETGGPRTEEGSASREEPGTDTTAPGRRDEPVPMRTEDETQPESVAQPENERGASRPESVARPEDEGRSDSGTRPETVVRPESEGDPGSGARPETVVRPESEPRAETETRSEDGVRPRPNEEAEGTGSRRTDEEATTSRGEDDTATPIPARENEVVPPRGRESEATPPRARESEAAPPRGRDREATSPRGREGERTPPRARDGEAAPPRGRAGEITAPRGREAEAAAAGRGLDEPAARNEAEGATTPREADRATAPREAEEATTPREADEASGRRAADEEEAARRAAEEEEAARREEEDDPPTVPTRRLSDEEAARMAAGEEPGALRVEGDWTQREFIPPLEGVGQRAYTKDQIVEMWENKIGRSMTPNEIRTLELGCVGISSTFAGHPLHPPNNLMFSDPVSYPHQFEYEKILAPLDRLNSDMNNARTSLREVREALRIAEEEHGLNPLSSEVRELRKSVKAWEAHVDQIQESAREAAAKLSGDLSMLKFNREMAMLDHGLNSQELAQNYKQRFEDILHRGPATREEFLQMVAEDLKLSQLRNVEQYLPSGKPSEWDVVMFAKHFYSGQEHVHDAAGNPLYHNGWPVTRATDPNPDLFRPDPETGQVDMSGDLCCPKGPGMGNFDFGLYLEDIDAWINANHMEYPDPVRRAKDPMKAFVQDSMGFHFYGGYYDSAVIGLAFRRIVP
ncbi:hypothetical protein [Nocardia sp. NPDC051750]|uniref:WXG100-like domain-containing protein n=1 Tax=Nocardia sp. NPDC051750 TaxID=3364325 RepID=UPI003787A234